MSIDDPLERDQPEADTESYEQYSGLTQALIKYGTKTALVAFVALLSFPLYFLIVSSTYPEGALSTFPPHLLPSANAIDNYAFILTETIFPRTFVNSIIFAGGITIGMLILSAPAGYALAKIDFKGSTTILFLILLLMAIPFQLMSIPLFELLVDMGLMNTFTGAILTSVTIPIAVFFVKQNAEQVLENDLLDSARVNGASEFQVFKNIVVPLLWPALMAITIYIFITRMQSYYWPLIVLRTEEVMVSQVWITIWEGGSDTPTPYYRILPASVVIIVPMLITFLIGQKYFIKGLTGGSLKG